MNKNEDEKSKKTNEVIPALPVSITPSDNTVYDIIRSSINNYHNELAKDPTFYSKRAATLLKEFKSCLSNLSEQSKKEYKSRMSRWGATSIVPNIDVKEKLLSTNRSTQTVNINKPSCAKCANKGKVKISYHMDGLKNEKVILSNVKIQLIPYKTRYFPTSSSSSITIKPAKIEQIIPLSDAEKQDYLITLDENGEKLLDWSDEKFAKYSEYHVVVLPVEEGEVDNWINAYQLIIDKLHKELQENWTNNLLPAWKAFENLTPQQQFTLLSDMWFKGSSFAVNEKIDEYKKAWQKFEEWDFRGWLDELFRERVTSDETSLTILQDEVKFYIAAYYSQCWMAMLPPHFQIIFSGKTYTTIMISMMELVAELVVETLIFNGVIAALTKIAEATIMLKGLLDSFSIMSNVLKEALQSEKSMNIFLRRFSNSIKITNNTTREVELSSGLKSLIEFNGDPSKKITVRIIDLKNGRVTNPVPSESADPISMVTGEERLTLIDGEFKHLLSFIWQRCYRSSAVEHNIGLGYGWSHSLAHSLLFEDDNVIWVDDGNLLTTFAAPTFQESLVINSIAQSCIYLDNQTNEYIISKGQGENLYYFKRFGNIGQLTAIGDKYGHRLIIIYDEKQRIIALQPQHDQSRRLVLSYIDNTSILIQSVSIQTLVNEEWQSIQTLMTYRYNDQQQLIATCDEAGQIESYEYDQNNVIQKRTMAGGAEFYWQWQGEGKSVRCTRQWSNFKQLDETYQWQDEDITVTMADGSKKSYCHKNGLLQSETDANGVTKTYQYNQYGLKTKEINGLGHETYYQYSANAELEAIIYPDNSYEKFTWQRGRIIRVNKNGQIWHFRYNEKNDLLEQETPDGLITQYTYNKHGQRLSAKYPDGTAHYFKWGEQGELLEQHFSDGRIFYFFYDSLLRLTKVCDGQQAETRYTYDKLGKITKICNPDGTNREYKYNAYGKVTWFKDETGKITEYKYAAPLHLITEKQLPNGDKLKFRYDNIHLQVSEIENQKGERYHLKYTPTGQLSEEIGFDGIKTTYYYDANGHLIEKQEFGNNDNEKPLITKYVRDSMGKLLLKELPDGIKEFYHYDNGKLVKVTDGQSVLAWEYDKVGRLIAEHQNWATIRHRYDEISNLLSGTKLPDGQYLEYYYQHGQLRGMSLDGESLVATVYDAMGRQIERRQGNGLINHYQYNKLGQLISHQLHRVLDMITDNSHISMWQQHYRYEADGQLAEVYGSQPCRYGYDEIGQLSTVSYLGAEQTPRHAEKTEQFLYDASGNNIVKQHSFSEIPLQANTAKGNRLTFFSDKHFEYDRFGNLICEKQGKDKSLLTHYEYDCRHRLIKVIKPTGIIITYTYDPFNRRTSKTVDGKTTEFIWQGNRLIAETDNDKHWQTYIYEPKSYRPLALLYGNAQQEKTQIYWYQNDQLGTPIALTNNRGEFIYQCQYNAYGQIIDEKYQTDKGLDLVPDNPLRFQGQYYDEETKLHYNLNRYYDPFIGRYITQDPIGILSDINVYCYVNNNPINIIDPSGLDLVRLYRGSIHNQEKELFIETGGILSDTGREVYFSARGEGYSVNEAWELAMAESNKIHEMALDAWGGIDQYLMAHAEFSHDIESIVKGRSLISFSSSFEVAEKFATYYRVGFIFEITLPKNLALKQPLLTSKEFEYLIINGVKP